MPVYVDRARHAYRSMVMCHMVADTAEELHAMAARIGVERRWFQANASFPHYDICRSKRALAIRCGAIEIDRRELVAVMRRVRAREAGADASPDAGRLGGGGSAVT